MSIVQGKLTRVWSPPEDLEVVRVGWDALGQCCGCFTIAVINAWPKGKGLFHFTLQRFPSVPGPELEAGTEVETRGMPAC